jgi:hypothetical protein
MDTVMKLKPTLAVAAILLPGPLTRCAPPQPQSEPAPTAIVREVSRPAIPGGLTVSEFVAECMIPGLGFPDHCQELRTVAIERTGDPNIRLFEDGSVAVYGCVVPEMGCDD